MIIKLDKDPFNEYHAVIKRSNTKKLELCNGDPYSYHFGFLHYKHPIILTQSITHVIIARELLDVTVIPNKNLLFLKTMSDDIKITNINSKLFKLIIDRSFSFPLRLGKNLVTLIFSHFYDQHVLLPKHLKHLKLFSSHNNSPMLPKCIQRINSFCDLVLDGVSDNVTHEYPVYRDNIVDNIPNNVHTICFELMFTLPLNNLPNCTKILIAHKSDSNRKFLHPSCAKAHFPRIR